MKKISIIYWSGTGNTEMMARAIADGASAEETDVKLLNVVEASLNDIEEADMIALGCPADGVESIESSAMEPFIYNIKDAVSDKPVILFGSYGWGNGEWMDDWEKLMSSYGADVQGEGLTIQDAPDIAGMEQCKVLGETMRA